MGYKIRKDHRIPDSQIWLTDGHGNVRILDLLMDSSLSDKSVAEFLTYIDELLEEMEGFREF